VFAEKGLGAATARDIVRETDLATGTFYNYFEDKEDVFRAVFDEFAAPARTVGREKRLQPGISLEQRLYDAYHSWFELVAADPQMFEVMRRNADAVAMLGADDLFEEAVRELVEDMGQWVAEGQLSAEIKPWLPHIARSIAGGGFQIAAHMADEGVSDVDATARFCTRLILEGIRGFR
jgi:AcrR family transcriptional regulator